MTRRELIGLILATPLAPLAAVVSSPPKPLSRDDEPQTGIWLDGADSVPTVLPDGRIRTTTTVHLRGVCWDAPLPVGSWRDYTAGRSHWFGVQPGFRRVQVNYECPPVKQQTINGRTLFTQELHTTLIDEQSDAPNDPRDRVETTIAFPR